MVTISIFIFSVISYQFLSILSLKVLPPISSPIEFISSVVDQVVVDEAKLQEFLPIFHYFVNFTALEKQSREEISILTATDYLENDENRLSYGSYSWADAIEEALNEDDNVTTHLYDSYEDVVEYINRFISKPEDLKETYIQSLSDGDNEDEDVHNEASAANETSHDAQRDLDDFWDATDTLDTRRIYKSNKTKIKLYPFMASVHLFENFACAGAIISSDLVITAASCLQLLWNNRFFRENPAFLSVRIGTSFCSIGGERIPVMEVYFYPKYTPKTLQNNLALMRLVRRIKFRRKRVSRVKKITIDRMASALSYYTPAITIIGWGSRQKSNLLQPAMLNFLQTLDLPYYDHKSCRDVYGSTFITRTNFCAGFITKGYGACNHDVGDPGVVGGTLMGITSFGSPVCGLEDTPTVFTKIGYYADWIDEIMEQEVPHMKLRTTTKAGPTYYPIDLLGIDQDEGKPLPPTLRDMELELELNQKLDIQPIDEAPFQSNQKPGIQPIVDTQELEAALVVREGHYSNAHSEENTDKSSHDGGEIDSSIDDKHYFDTTAPSGLRVTKIMGDDPPKDSISREDDRHKEKYDSGNSESSEWDEIAYDKSVIPDAGVTAIPDINIDLKEYMWSQPPPAHENDKEYPLFENDKKRHRTTEINLNNHAKEYTVMEEKRKRKIVTPKVDKGHEDESNLRSEEGSRGKNKHELNPIIYEDVLTEVRSKEKQDNNYDILRKLPVDSQTDDHVQDVELSREEIAAEVSEDMIKTEIEKLIRELDGVSSEMAAHNPSNNLNSKDTFDSDNVLSILYLSDSEKKMKPRTRYEVTEDEGLSIDSKPFEKNAKIRDDLVGDLIGDTEVFNIFAGVIDSMVNKSIK